MRILVFLGVFVISLASFQSIFAQCDPVRLAPPDIDAGDFHGFYVAVSGDRAVVSSRNDDDLGADSGSVTVYERSSGVWSPSAKLRASDGDDGDLFGMSVDIDGDLVVVGAMTDEDRGFDAGSAYIFERVGGTWLQSAKVTASDAAANDWFGVSVAIHNGVAIVGARVADRSVGAAYVYEKVGGVWTETAKLSPSHAQRTGRFGHAVGMSGDTIMVGAFRVDTSAGVDSGAVYVYERQGSQWVETQTLIAADSAANDWFGVDLSIDGDRTVISGRMNDDPVLDGGAAYVFERRDGSWEEVARLDNPAPFRRDEFGNKVALSGDRIVIGCWQDDVWGNNSGAAYLFEKRDGGWHHTRDLAPAVLRSGDLCGHDVAIHGSTILLGSFSHDGLAVDGGAAFVWETPDLTLTIAPPDADVGDTVTLEARGGSPTQSVMLVLRDVGGAPTYLPFAFGSFDGNGSYLIQADVPPDFGGTTFGIQAVGISSCDLLDWTEPQTLTVR